MECDRKRVSTSSFFVIRFLRRYALLSENVMALFVYLKGTGGLVVYEIGGNRQVFASPPKWLPIGFCQLPQGMVILNSYLI
mmetsp:Transcript_8161/g.11855  ORF Transcript_8161/g.11855 Transcript_8161/m.11855 type:complete len:81 (-) Transcript_8161:60-302(-)